MRQNKEGEPGEPANFELEVGERGLRRYPAMPAKSISKENIISRGKRPLNSVVNKRFKLQIPLYTSVVIKTIGMTVAA